MSRFGLEDRVALVTGASRGIGRALALGLADAGAAVVASARDLAACQAVVAAIETNGGRALAHRLDIADRSTHQPLLDATIARFGRLDVLVNNAGILKPHVTTKVSERELDEVLAVNLKGPLFLSVAALPLLATHGVGSIVNIGALAASQPMEGLGAYAAAKAAMANWSTTMAREWADRNVRVNVLVPGSIATDMILPKDPERRAAFEADLGAQNLFGRLGQPDDLVGGCVFLASDASAFMTGRSIFVDGGLMK